jgi:hypothetical protein
MPFFFDWTMLLILPAAALAIWAQFKVKSTYAAYNQVPNAQGISGAVVAAAVLRDAGISVTPNPDARMAGNSCGIERIEGELTDHYDPRAHMLRLSDDVFHGTSIAAVGIAAHEAGHAVQHAQLYAPLTLRNFVYPVCSLGSTLAFPLFLIGFFLPVGFGQPVIHAAIALFSLAVFFAVLTLPVEFDASRRAVRALASGGFLSEDELGGARKVLNAAAMTYVAAAAMALMQLARMLLLSQRRD